MSENTWAPLSPTANSHWNFRIRKYDENDPFPYEYGDFTWSEADQRYHETSPNESKGNPVVHSCGYSSSSRAPNDHRQVSSRLERIDRPIPTGRVSGPIDLTDQGTYYQSKLRMWKTPDLSFHLPVAATAPWTKEEDQRLKSLVEQGANWNDCATHLPCRSNVSCQDHFDELCQRWYDPLLRWYLIEKQRQIEIVKKGARSSKRPATSMRDPPSHSNQAPSDTPQPGPLEVTILNSSVQAGLQNPPEQHSHGFQKW